MDRGRSSEASPASSRSSSGWFAILQDDLFRQRRESAKPTGDFPQNRPMPQSDDAQTALPQPTSRPLSRHQRGVCDPCVFFTTSLGCRKGKECRYCHLPHPDSDAKTVNRPRKQTRDKYKAAIQELLQKNEGRLHDIHDELQSEARKNPYIRKVLQGYLDYGLDGVPARPSGTPNDDHFQVPSLLATSPPAVVPTSGFDVSVSGYRSAVPLWQEAARDVASESEESHKEYSETLNENRSWNMGMTHPAESSSSALGLLIDIAKSGAPPGFDGLALGTADLQ